MDPYCPAVEGLFDLDLKIDRDLLHRVVNVANLSNLHQSSVYASSNWLDDDAENFKKAESFGLYLFTKQ